MAIYFKADPDKKRWERDDNPLHVEVFDRGVWVYEDPEGSGKWRYVVSRMSAPRPLKVEMEDETKQPPNAAAGGAGPQAASAPFAPTKDGWLEWVKKLVKAQLQKLRKPKAATAPATPQDGWFKKLLKAQWQKVPTKTRRRGGTAGAVIVALLIFVAGVWISGGPKQEPVKEATAPRPAAVAPVPVTVAPAPPPSSPAVPAANGLLPVQTAVKPF